MSRPARQPELALEFSLLKSARVPKEVDTAATLEALAVYVLQSEGVRSPVFLTVDFVNHAQIQRLNRHYRGVDRTTDVISFRDDLPAAGAPARYEVRSKRYWAVSLPKPGHALQGDLAINVEQAAIQAKKVGHPLRREVRLLLTHGILHLLGYTDYDPIPRRKMFKRQSELLRRWERGLLVG